MLANRPAYSLQTNAFFYTTSNEGLLPSLFPPTDLPSAVVSGNTIELENRNSKHNNLTPL
jgi:hypothetical protein